MHKEGTSVWDTIVLNDNINVYVNVYLSYQNGNRWVIIKNIVQLTDDKTHVL